MKIMQFLWDIGNQRVYHSDSNRVVFFKHFSDKLRTVVLPFCLSLLFFKRGGSFFTFSCGGARRALKAAC